MNPYKVSASLLVLVGGQDTSHNANSLAAKVVCCAVTPRASVFGARVEQCSVTEMTYSTSSQSLECVKRVSYEVPAVAVLPVQRTVGLSRGRDGAGWANHAEWLHNCVNEQV